MIDFSIASRAAKAWRERKKKLSVESKESIYKMAYYRGFRDSQELAKGFPKKADKINGPDKADME
jgi:hypothetical protein